MANSSSSRRATLPFWRSEQKVVLPAVFIAIDGSSLDDSSSSSSSNVDGFVEKIAKRANEQLLNGSNPVDVVHFILSRFGLNKIKSGDGQSSNYQNALLLNGDTKKSGAVAYYRSQRLQAVDAARFVLEKTEHNLMCGDEARAFIEKSAEKEGVNQLKCDEEATDEAACLVFDCKKPLAVNVMVVDQQGRMACGSYAEQLTKQKAARLNDSLIVGSGLYADSKVGSVIAINLGSSNNDENEEANTSGQGIAWLATQLMRDYAAGEQLKNKESSSSLSAYLKTSLPQYVCGPAAIFALHCSDEHDNQSSASMKLSMFLFGQTDFTAEKLTVNDLRRCASISLTQSASHVYWSTSTTDFLLLTRNPGSGLFEAHPSGATTPIISDHEEAATQKTPNGSFTIIVHGGAGAGALPEEYREQSYQGIKDAVLAGHKVLASSTGTAVEAVRAAVRSLENNPVFNAGYGSSLTQSRRVEMDAMLQDGVTGRFGSVCGVKRVKNPVDLCNALVEHDGNKKAGGQLLIGDVAVEFAQKHGSEVCDDEDQMISEKAAKLYEKLLEKKHQQKNEFGAIDLFDNNVNNNNNAMKCGTVGAAAIDQFGNVAAATSTGGLTGKIDGRVGDSPLPGCGTSADNRFGAASATGVGEHIMATCVARACLHLMEQGHSAQEAAELATNEHLGKRWRGSASRCGSGGVICVNPKTTSSVVDGKTSSRRWGFAFNTEGMIWAAIDKPAGENTQATLHNGLLPGQEFTETLN